MIINIKCETESPGQVASEKRVFNTDNYQFHLKFMMALPSPSALDKLKELNLYSKKWMNDAACENLASMLSSNTSLTFIGFRECRQLGDKGAAAIAKALSKNQTIKKINFESTNVGDNGVFHIAQSLSLPQCSLYRLDLSYCSIGDKGADALSRAISLESSQLGILMLEHCKNVTNHGGKSLVTALKENTSLKTLGVRGTSISADLRAQIEAILTPVAVLKKKSRSSKISLNNEHVIELPRNKMMNKSNSSNSQPHSALRVLPLSSSSSLVLPKTVDAIEVNNQASNEVPSLAPMMMKPKESNPVAKSRVRRKSDSLSSLKGRLRDRQTNSENRMVAIG